MLKKNLREKLLRKRDSIEPDEKRKKDAAIRKRLYSTADFRKAKNILFYASFRSEAATIQCIIACIEIKKDGHVASG